MKNTLSFLLLLTFCFSKGSIPNLTENLKEQLLNKYKIKSLSDFKKYTNTSTRTNNRREMGDIVGDWTLQKSNEFYDITVEEDQSIFNQFSLMGLSKANGYLNATTNNFSTELNYLIDFESIFGGDNDDDGGSMTYCDPIDESNGEGWYCCSCNCQDFDDVECTQSEYESGECEVPCDQNRDGHTTTTLNLYQYDSGCDGWAGEWAITYSENDLDTVAYGGAPEGCDSMTELELELNREYIFSAGLTGDENADSEYSYLLVRTNEDGAVDTISSGYAGQGNGFYVNDYSQDYGTYLADILTPDECELYANENGYVWDGIFCDAEYHGIEGGCYQVGNNTMEWQSNDESLCEYEDEPNILFITNMNFMEFFIVAFFNDWESADSLEIVNPVAIALELGDDGFKIVDGIVGSDTGFVEVYADSTMDSYGTVDSTNLQFTVENTVFYDSLGNSMLEVSGTIGPDIFEFLAGQTTTIDIFDVEEMMGDNSENETIYVSLFSDSTGYDITSVGDGDSAYIDTTYLDWYATSDSLFLQFQNDSSDGEDSLGTTNLNLAYTISNDTLTMFQFEEEFTCDSFPDIDACLDSLSEDDDLYFLRDLETINSISRNGRAIWTSGHLVAIDNLDGLAPKKFELHSNYPNPFNPVTTIRFDIDKQINGNTKVNVYDVNGRSIATLLNEPVGIGSYELQWNAKNFSSGVYFLEVVHGQNRQSQKMILLK